MLSTEKDPRLTCARCGRPQPACYCSALVSLESTTRVLVLQHPRERDKAVGTARIAALCLPSSHVAIGVDFTSDPAVHALVRDPERPPILLYPSPAARDLSRERPSGPVTLVVLDGTWHHARRIFRKNPWLAALPHYAFTPEHPSEYRIRHEPQEDYVSTIEALATTLGLLEGDPERFAQLLVPFRAMVDHQVAHAARSLGPRRRTRRREGNSARSRLPRELDLERLVCVAVEANAWPYDRQEQRAVYPDEVVQLAAFRPRDGASLEVVITPRQPLAPSTQRHTGLTVEQLELGASLETAREAWARFLGPGEVLCAWGSYGLNLLRRERFLLPEAQLDLRKVTGDVLRERPGSVEAWLARTGLSPTPLGQGRAGRRLAALVLAARRLDENSRAYTPEL